MTKLLRPSNAKAIWGRSAAAMAAVLLAWKELYPEAPLWMSLVLAGVVLVVEQVFRPSKSAKE